LLNRVPHITLRSNFFDQLEKITDNALRKSPRTFETPRFIEIEQIICPYNDSRLSASITKRDVKQIPYENQAALAQKSLLDDRLSGTVTPCASKFPCAPMTAPGR
jgi:hypothetical protein